MPKRRLRQRTDDIVNAVTSGDLNILKDLCPCRNRVGDPEVWRAVFDAARHGDRHTRHQAAHAIATLLDISQTSAHWRDLLRDLNDDLKRTMNDDRASRHLLGQVAHQAGHARKLKGSAIKTYRHQRRVLDLASREELAAWINRQLGLQKHRGVSMNHPGVDRLWRWLDHRRSFQHRRRVEHSELLKKAMQWLPDYFDRPAARVG